MQEYVVLISGEGEVWGAEIPDPPGRFAVGKSRDEVLEGIRSAAAFHIEGLIASGEEVPQPRRRAATIPVPILQAAA
jgi:predicted RNase H-like HicB family nuclease